MTTPERLDRAALTSSGDRAAVTPHYLASQAAIEILDRGGNAVDAAIAANATLGVVAPETCGIGGDLFALIHGPGEDRPVALNSSGRAGEGARAAAIREQGYTEIPIESPYAVTVPGCVDGWLELARSRGTLAIEQLLEPAIRHARYGFPASPELSISLQRLAPSLAPQPAATGLYPNGQPPAIGDLVNRPQLAETLSGIAAAGREGFYAGPVADAIVTATRGVLHHDDLARSQADWVDPISIDVMGWTGWTIPPNSQGYLTLAAAWLFEQLAPPHDPGDPAFTHAAIEAYRAVAWERDDFVSEPGYSAIPAGELLDQRRLERRFAAINPERRNPWPTPHPAPGGTAYLCVRDRDGTGISLIQSNYHGIGSRIGAGDRGFFLHDRGSGFNLEPGHANELGPGKRPLHTLSPTLWTEQSQLRMLLGTRGGDFQPQTLLQMLTYLRWAGLEPESAQTYPRWATQEWRDRDTTVSIEPHMPRPVLRGLERRGHDVAAAEGWMAGWGPVSVITCEDDNVRGAADPRVAATAAFA